MVFKLLLKSIALTVILIALFAYGVYLKTGKWIAPNIKQLSLPKTEFKLEVPGIVPKIKAKIPAPDKKIYKWQDEQGVWHYETKKPLIQQAEELNGSLKNK